MQRDKRFTLTGFVRPTENGSPDSFLLSRFVLVCCAIDATPASVEVYYPGWQNKFPIDSWATVSATLGELNDGLGIRPGLINAQVTTTQEPNLPYDYL
jgi:uncharacterized membrane protein YcgQ (UPF0703/DUF1980 family)